jgi:protein SCO1/2
MLGRAANTLAGLALLSATSCQPAAEGPAAEGRTSARSAASSYRGTLLPDPIQKPDFVLPDTRDRPFDFQARTRGFVTLLFFGYTSCPDVCPVHLANLGLVLAKLPPEVRTQINVVFITTDPDTDTPERMKEWLAGFHPDFIGLRGTLDEVNEIQGRLGLPHAVVVKSDEGHTVGHSSAILAFTKDGLAHLRYPFGIRQADWAHDLPRLVQEDWVDS